MKIKTKIAAATVGISALAVLLSGVITRQVSSNQAERALRDAAHARLTAVAQIQKSVVENYFSTIRSQIITYADNGMIRDAMKEFRAAYQAYPSYLVTRDTAGLAALRSYYDNQFGTEFKSRNNGESADIASMFNRLDRESLALQTQYISKNTHPLGNKHRLDAAEDGSAYARAHKKYHPIIRQYLEQFAYYDIFLADPETGDIIYSVFKELDYTTSLIDGPYATMGIGQAFRAANQATSADFVALTDFAPYLPSYNDPASFIASPIFDGGQKIGVLIFQMPLDRINAELTFEKEWAAAGLGETGETYVVGKDGFLRSQRRGMVEHPEDFVDALGAHGDSAMAETIKIKGTTIGLEKVSHEAQKNGTRGKSSVAQYTYLGKNRIGASAPLEIEGVEWAVIAEIAEAEAMEASASLSSTLLNWSLAITALTILLSTALGLVVARSVTRPILRLAKHLMTAAGESRFEERLNEASTDEVGQAADAVDQLFESLQSVISDIGRVTGAMANSDLSTGPQATYRGDLSAIRDGLRAALSGLNRMMKSTLSIASQVESHSSSLTEVSGALAAGAHEQTAAAHESLSALEETSSVASTNAKSATRVAGLSSQAETSAHRGQEHMKGLAQAMQQIQASSKDVVGVVKSIEEIAFQTDLLALNAAVEAARAGKHGRGFAIVAQQVQNLAARSAQSAKDAQEMVSRSDSSITHGVELTGVTAKALEEIVQISSEVSSLVNDIDDASGEQSTGIEHIREAMGQVSSAAEGTLKQGREVEQAAGTMAEQSKRLLADLARFRLADTAAAVAHAPIEPAAPAPSPGRAPGLPPLSEHNGTLDRDDRSFNGF